MSGPVFANSMEVSSKSMGGKSICEFPDVCFTPPTTPATPPGVPIPYPNTGMASDTTSGSTSVNIGGKEVMLKDKSYFKQSTGDEAGCAPKKGIVTSKIKGKVYFLAWSMDVKVEGENVVRNLDMTTHNHGSTLPNGSVPTVHAAQVMVSDFSKCGDDAQAIEEACKGKKPEEYCPGVLAMGPKELKAEANPRRRTKRDARVAQHASVITQKSAIPSKAGLPTSRSEAAGAVATAEADGDKCVQKMRCFLRPYKGEGDGQTTCCKGQTPHHIPPQADVNELPGYDHGSALCVCLEGTNQSAGSHGKNHAMIDHLVDQRKPGSGPLTLKEHIQICSAAVAVQCGCKAECIQEQLETKTFKNNDKSAEVKHVAPTSLKPTEAEKTALKTQFNALRKTSSAR